ncbi:MerR family transcriptional regulator [bacterium]|nr:MerR family transcriptional regulator [bacterium]
MNNQKLFYKISDVAKKVGVTPQTVRNRIKDFPQLHVKTDVNGRRSFTKNNIDILIKIEKLRKRGYTVQGIKNYFSKRVDKNIESIIIRINKLIDRIDNVL